MFAPPPADVRIEVHYKPARPSLSDLIELEVTLKGAGSDVILGSASIPPGCVSVESIRESGNSRIYTLDPIQPGSCRIPAFHTRCLDSNHAAGCDVASAETEIPIGTVVPMGVTPPPDIRDRDEGPVAVPQSRPASPWWWALLALPFGVAAFFAALMWQRHPAVRARRRLRRARPGGFDELHNAFRDYLASRFLFNARACTSPETIEVLARVCLLPELPAFLAACDRARFSGSPVSGFDEAKENCLVTIRTLEHFKSRKPHARV